MNLNQLESFYTVVQCKGFAAAAAKLGVSKGLISRHVANLEGQLKTKLLFRTTRVVRPTQAGEMLYLKAQQIFILAENAQREVEQLNDSPSGLLRFTAPISIGDTIVDDIVKRYTQLCPQVELELNFTNQASDLATGENDIALRAFDSLPATVVAKSLGNILNLLVVKRGYFAAGKALEFASQINTEQCILSSHQQAWNIWQLQDVNTKEIEQVAVSGRFACAKYSTALRMALAGFGVANLPYYLVEPYLNSGQLEWVLPNYHNSAHELFVIHAEHRPLPQKISIFKQLLVQWFDEHPQYLC